MENSVTLEMIRDAREALKDVAELTPVVTSTRFGKNLFIKSENLQKTGSFKIRGAYNKIRNCCTFSHRNFPAGSHQKMWIGNR